MRAHRTRKLGFTLVEILMAVSIMAVLLLATSAALKASVDSFGANQSSADTLLRARMTLTRIAQQIRSGSDHYPNNVSKQSSFFSGSTVTDSGISLTNDEGAEISYQFVADTNSLTVSVDGAAARTLASNVSSFTIKLTPTRSAEAVKTGGGYDELEHATITISLIPEVDGRQLVNQTLVLSESVTPRARLWN